MKTSITRRCGASEHDRKHVVTGRTLENAPTGTLYAAQEFEFLRFRFDYVLRKRVPNKNEDIKYFPIISTR